MESADRGRSGGSIASRGERSTDRRQPSAAASDASPVVPERWNLYFQATAIGDEHGTFYAPYTGPLSLQDYPNMMFR